MNIEKFRNIWMDDDHDGEVVFDEVVDDTWRHGCTHEVVVKSGDEYWLVWNRVSGDGEYNELRDEWQYMSAPVQVKPQEVTVINYVPVK